MSKTEVLSLNLVLQSTNLAALSRALCWPSWTWEANLDCWLLWFWSTCPNQFLAHQFKWTWTSASHSHC